MLQISRRLRQSPVACTRIWLPSSKKSRAELTAFAAWRSMRVRVPCLPAHHTIRAPCLRGSDLSTSHADHRCRTFRALLPSETLYLVTCRHHRADMAQSELQTEPASHHQLPATAHFSHHRRHHHFLLCSLALNLSLMPELNRLLQILLADTHQQTSACKAGKVARRPLITIKAARPTHLARIRVHGHRLHAPILLTSRFEMRWRRMSFPVPMRWGLARPRLRQLLMRHQFLTLAVSALAQVPVRMPTQATRLAGSYLGRNTHSEDSTRLGRPLVVAAWRVMFILYSILQLLLRQKEKMAVSMIENANASCEPRFAQCCSIGNA